MSKQIKHLDHEHERIVCEQVEDLINYLNTSIYRSEVYSHINMCLNVLTGALITIAHNYVDEEDEEKFIKNILITLKANFDANRKNKRCTQEKLGR